MQVTCPEGHTIEIADPADGHVLVGTVNDGLEVYGEAFHPQLIVLCNAMVVRLDANGNPENVQCGITFDAKEA